MVQRLTSRKVQGERWEEHGVVPRVSTRPQSPDVVIKVKCSDVSLRV